MRPGTVSVSALDELESSVPGEVVSGIQAKISNYQISEGSRPSSLRAAENRAAFHMMGSIYESKCRFLRCHSDAPAVG